MSAMELKLNREFLLRHLFVAVLMAGLACWFGYDGFVRYPRSDARDLYVSIEGSEPPAGLDLEAFKAQKTKSQHGFALLSLLASAAVALHLLAVSRLRLRFDEDGFDFGGRRRAYGDVASVDDSKWESKGISKVTLADGARVVVDSWHHEGAKEFHEMLIGKAKK